MTQSANKGAAGWARPLQWDTRCKFHYWEEGGRRSLCKNWERGALPDEAFEDTDDDHKDNCAACRKKKAALGKKAKQ